MACRLDREPGWYRDPEQLREEFEAHHKTYAEISRVHGGAATTYQKWGPRAGLTAQKPGPKLHLVPPLVDDDSWLLSLLKKHKDTATVEELADEADVSPRKVRDALERLGRDGYRVAADDDRVVLSRVPIPSGNVHRALFKGETVRFGVVSDTHLGSKHERVEELHHAYNVFKDEGIDTVYHPGDLVCGYGIFPGQNNEVHQHTYQDQVDYAALNYPKVDGIKTHLIGGNHDLEGSWGKAGANPCVAFCNQRDDFEYLGDYNATVELEQGTRINLLHPKGGMGYAADYKVRKLAEGFESGSKPNVMLIGHFHRRFDVEARGIHALLCGCFEAGGSFGPRLGLSDPAVGFHIVTMTVADDGSVVKWMPQWHRFWPGRQVARAA